MGEPPVRRADGSDSRETSRPRRRVAWRGADVFRSDPAAIAYLAAAAVYVVVAAVTWPRRALNPTVARALVGCQVIVHAAVDRGADAHLLGAAAPVLDIVARAQAREAAQVVGVDVAGVAHHRFAHPEDVGAAGAQRLVGKGGVARREPSRAGV